MRRRRGGEPAPSFFQSLHKERQLPPEHQGEPQLLVDGPSQKDPAPNGSLSTLLVKIILHIILYEPHRLHKAKALGIGKERKTSAVDSHTATGRRKQEKPAGAQGAAETPAATPAGQSELGRLFASQSELRRSPAGQSELSAPTVPANGRAGVACAEFLFRGLVFS